MLMLLINLVNRVFTQSELLARYCMARQTKIGSILFLLHNKVIFSKIKHHMNISN
jgi:hypothetical protein